MRSIFAALMVLLSCSSPVNRNAPTDSKSPPALSDSGVGPETTSPPVETISADSEVAAGDMDTSVEGDGGLGLPDSSKDAAVSQPAVSQTTALETAGGGTLNSTNYRLQLFVAPSRPVAWLKSNQYQLILGPRGGQK